VVNKVKISFDVKCEGGSRARHGFVNPRGYLGMGWAGTDAGLLGVTCRKPIPMVRVWRVFYIYFTYSNYKLIWCLACPNA
jgi:hypothetical protein